MDLANILLLITSIVAFMLAGFVYVSNPKREVSQSLSLFLGSIFIWLIANLLTNISKNVETSLMFARLTLVGPALMGYFFVLFAQVFATGTQYTRKQFLKIAIPPGLLLITVPTSLNIESIQSYGRNTVAGPVYNVLILYLVLYFGNGLIKLTKAYYGTHQTVRRRQIKYIFFGVVSGFIPGVILNGIMPAIGYNEAVFYGPSAIIFTGVLMTVAIAKHRFLDIRLVVTRALAYIFTIAAIGALYTAVIFTLGTFFINLSNISLSQRIFLIALALLIAVTYAPIISFFNQITNRFFYRDAYDTQVVLSRVSDVIVGNIDPHKVQKGTLSAITDALKPTYAVFLLNDTSQKLKQGHLVGQQWNMHDPENLTSTLRRIGKKVLVYDEVEEAQKKLKETLRIEDISIVSPLITKDETIGYLVLGPKKSGNIYNSQDIGLLNIASNELAVALQNAQRFEEIQAFNITLQKKVTEATHELKVTNKKLVALDEAKDEFISIASHQLRTPLTSIKGYLSMLSEGDMGKLNAKQLKATQDAFASSQRMVFLIADFLNVSRIKTGKFVIQKTKVDLATMITDELAQLKELFEAKDLKLSYDPPYDFPMVMLDDNKMRQVMMNMIDNAIYYTPAGGTITVQLYKTADEIIFKVVDTGIGVAKEEQHKLFTKFFRATNAKKARPDGTGLGLFMAQKIVVGQEGAVIFESVENKGSTFGFRFPLEKIKA